MGAKLRSICLGIPYSKQVVGEPLPISKESANRSRSLSTQRVPLHGDLRNVCHSRVSSPKCSENAESRIGPKQVTHFNQYNGHKKKKEEGGVEQDALITTIAGSQVDTFIHTYIASQVAGLKWVK